MTLKKALKIARTRAGMTNDQLVRKMGRSLTMIQMVVTGEATSAPLKKKILRFIKDTDPSLLDELDEDETEPAVV